MERLIQYSGKEKYHELLKFSDPKRTMARIRQLGLDPKQLFVSPLKTKKYLYITPDGKKVHYGYMGMYDYTKHQDEARRKRFQTRNAKWKDTPKYSSSWMSYWTIW